MYNFYEWFASSPLASFLRVFAAILLSSAVAHFAEVGSFDVSRWEAWVIAALVASTPTLLRWLNPADSLGRG